MVNVLEGGMCPRGYLLSYFQPLYISLYKISEPLGGVLLGEWIFFRKIMVGPFLHLSGETNSKRGLGSHTRQNGPTMIMLV